MKSGEKAHLRDPIRWLLVGILFCELCLVWRGGAGLAAPPLASAEIEIAGLSASVEPAAPVVPRDVPSALRVVLRAEGQALTDAQVMARLGPDLEVRGVLAGPGFDGPIAVASSPDAPLLLPLPAIHRAGDHSVRELRLLSGGRPILDITPESLTVQVFDQLLLTSLETRPLSLDEIRSYGIVLDADDYLGFEYVLAWTIDSEVVEITFPVVFDRQGVPLPDLPLPGDGELGRLVNLPDLGTPPQVAPLLLDVPPSGGGGGGGGGAGGAGAHIPGVLIIPGDIGYLKQFFRAALFVANAAPDGAPLRVRDLSATIELPPGEDGVVGSADDPLSLAESQRGPGSRTVPLVEADGGDSEQPADLSPGDQGMAEFFLRGDLEGFHRIAVDVEGTLDGLGLGPVQVQGQVAGGVLVRNAVFDLTFTVPDVVRLDEEMSVFVTVTNIGQGLGNDLRVALDEGSLSGLEPLGEMTQRIETLRPGNAETLEFRFRALRTGQVTSTYLRFDASDDGHSGHLRFMLGVDERGVPLSPDTLALPGPIERLPPGVLRAAMRVLGQAWSVAHAPRTLLPADVKPIRPDVVYRSALLLAEAALRMELGEDEDAALRGLLLDWMSGPKSSVAGGAQPDPGFDQLLRETEAGQAFLAALGAALDPEVLEQEALLARIAASGPDLLSFAVAAGDPVLVTLTDKAGRRLASEDPGASQGAAEIASAALLPLGDVPGASWLGLMTQPSCEGCTLEISGGARLAVTIPGADGALTRTTARTRGPAQLTIRTGAPPALAEDRDGDGRYETAVDVAVEPITPGGPRLLSATVLGPETLPQAHRAGIHAILLFDRVVDPELRSAQLRVPDNQVVSASRQLSGRLVMALLDAPEGPYIETTMTVSGLRDGRGAVGPELTVPLTSRIPTPGAVVSGRVSLATGEAVGHSEVVYSLFVRSDERGCLYGEWDPVASVPTDAEGRYALRFAVPSDCDMPFRLSAVDPITKVRRDTFALPRRAGERILLDIVHPGRGGVTGTVHDLHGRPVPGAEVLVTSAAEPWSQASGIADGLGHYEVQGISVGTVSVRARSAASLGRAAGRILDPGHTAEIDVVLDGGAVFVSGTVWREQPDGIRPFPGALVAYSVEDQLAGYAWTDEEGRYTLEGMPVGPFAITSLDAEVMGRLVSVTGIGAFGDRLTDMDLVVPALNPVEGVGKVRGRVYTRDGAVVAGATVGLVDAALTDPPDALVGVLSDEDGRFELVDVPFGRDWRIIARTPDGLREGEAPVTLESPGDSARVNVTVSGLGAATITVLDPLGEPIRGLDVRVLGDCDDACGCEGKATDRQGRARFVGLEPGNLGVLATRSQGTAKDLSSGYVEVLELETVEATLRFPGVGSVSGTVAAPEGVEVAGGGTVLLKTHTYVGCILTPTVRTEAIGLDGRFRFDDVNLGGVNIVASHPFFPVPVGASGALVEHGQELVFALTLNDTSSGELSGQVMMPDGVTPAPAGVVVEIEGDFPLVSIKTDADGRFHLAKVLPAGQYTITATHPTTGLTTREQILMMADSTLVHDLRLLGRGQVDVRVLTSDGAPVADAQVALTELAHPARTLRAVSGEDGLARFVGVFEGAFAVQASDDRGTGGRALGVIAAPDTESVVELRLGVTGHVRGRFVMPNSGVSLPSSQVRLLIDGAMVGVTTTTGGDASWLFDWVPAGPLVVEATDPVSGRTGRAAGVLETEGQILELALVAQGLGSVRGRVMSQRGGESRAEPGATVRIIAAGVDVYTTADGEGRYLISGIPEGPVTVVGSLADGGLIGAASAQLAGEGAELELDVYLSTTGVISGRVLRWDGVSPAWPAELSLTFPGSYTPFAVVVGRQDGSFEIPRLPVGAARLTASLAGTVDRAAQDVVVTAGDNAVSLVLTGVGGLSGQLLDQRGRPQEGTVTVLTAGKRYTLGVDVDGLFAIDAALAGPVTIQARVETWRLPLYGTIETEILPDQTTHVEVRVEDSGVVLGAVRQPDLSPAVGFPVVLQTARGSLRLITDSEGAFRVPGVPLGEVQLALRDPTGGGVARASGTLREDGQELDLGTLTLDATPVEVLSVTPAGGAVDVAIDQPIRIAFSDAVASWSGAVAVGDGGGAIPFTGALSDGGRTLTLTGAWPDDAEITVLISTGLLDVFGRSLAQTWTSSLRTVDLSGPRVIRADPAADAVEIPTTSAVVVVFDEAVASGPTLTLEGPSGAVPGALTRLTDASFSFAPSRALAKDARYTATVQGAVDAKGNVQDRPFSFSFSTPDTVAPTLTLLIPAAEWTKDPSTPIEVLVADALSGLDPGAAALELDGRAASLVRSGDRLRHVPTTPLADGQHQLRVQASDRAGNDSVLETTFGVDVTAPSAPLLTGAEAGARVSGALTLTATAEDTAAGIERVELWRGDQRLATLNAPTLQAALDTTILPEGPLTLVGRAFDRAGNASELGGSLDLIVDNQILTVRISAPSEGTRVRDAVAITATATENVQHMTFSAGQARAEDDAAPYTATLDVSGEPEGELTLTALASGPGGDSDIATIRLFIDRTPPAAPDLARITAEPPIEGFTLVYGTAGAVEGGATLTAEAGAESVSGRADANGGFAISLRAEAGDVVALTATDEAGNRGPASAITVSAPEVPPTSSEISLDGVSALDLVGSGGLAPDGAQDAAFTLTLLVGEGVRQEVVSIDLQGPSLLSTRPGAGGPLGVERGGHLLNSPDGSVSFPVTGSGAVRLLSPASFLVPGTTFVATVRLASGTQLVARVELPPLDRRAGVVRSLSIQAEPPTVRVGSTAPGTALLILTDLRDQDGEVVPDGAKVALTVANGAALNPDGGALASDGGALVGGAAAVDPRFMIFEVRGGQIEATYSSDSLAPPGQGGAVALVAVVPADDAGETLTRAAIATLPLNLRAATEQAVVGLSPSSLYADGTDRRATFSIEVRDAAGAPVSDGTKIVVSAANCATRWPANNYCVSSAGGQVGAAGGPLGQAAVLTVVGGRAAGVYSSAGITSGSNASRIATLQVLPAGQDGVASSGQTIGVANLTLTGASSATVRTSMASAPAVHPGYAVQVEVSDVRDTLGNPVPDGAKIRVTTAPCATRYPANNYCVDSWGGTLADGLVAPDDSAFRVYTLEGGRLVATWRSEGLANVGPGQTGVIRVQLLAGDADGRNVGGGQHFYLHELPTGGPASAVGEIDPAGLIADGAARSATITFRAPMDPWGTLLPNGTKVVVVAAHCAARWRQTNYCVDSAGGRIESGEPSPSGDLYRVHTVEDGVIVIRYDDFGLKVPAAATASAVVSLLPANADGSRASDQTFATVAVPLSAVHSATASITPQATIAGGEFAVTVRFDDLRARDGLPIPDGARLAVSVANCAARWTGTNYCIDSIGGAILSGETVGSWQIHTVENQSITVRYSPEAVLLNARAQATATLQVLPATPEGQPIGGQAALTAAVRVLAPGAATVTAEPASVLADGAARTTQVTLRGLVGADEATVVPDGAVAGLAAADCAARWTGNNYCVQSAGGAVSASAAGDGQLASNNSTFRLFTLRDGAILATYNAAGLTVGSNASATARVVAVPADTRGVLSGNGQAFAVGEVRLVGLASAVPEGPTTATSGAAVPVRFTDLRDQAGQPLPDGARVAISAVHCAARYPQNNYCVASSGGQILDGEPSPSGGGWRVFVVQDGAVDLTFEAGALGAARLQLMLATPDGTVIGTQIPATGGEWMIGVTP